ncbi:hypothetical protein [Sporichthya polymorpha]|uniref:hypothetical protein n=1 Tax=Sporichthya polymorpha TaxID=35751 RepID=UPI00036558EA|nr:hypothetical protein [Sporichthya polymorpha]
MDLKVLKSQWDRTAAIALTIAGAVCFLLGYAGVADSAYLAEQTRYIVSGGIGGIFLLGLGATLWISADLRDEWRKLDRIERALGEGVLRWDTDVVRDVADANSRTATEIPVTNTNGASARSGLAHAAASRDHA